MVKLILAMIVKNEEHCIRQCFERYGDLDALAIIDTGSSDRTIEIIKEYAEEKKIAGRIISRKWVNFSVGRNQSLLLAQLVARELNGLPGTGPLLPEELQKWEDTYLTFTDADNSILPKDQTGVSDYQLSNHLIKLDCQVFLKPEIASGGGKRIIINNSYTRDIVFPIDPTKQVNYKFYCPLHEYPSTLGNQINFSTLKECYLHNGYYGARSRDPVKYHRDSLILREAYYSNRLDKADRDRCLFYLAQSLSATGDYCQSKNFYLEYIKIGSSPSYQYVAYLRIASLVKDPEEKLTYYSIAYQLNPRRREAIYHLSKYFEGLKSYRVAWELLRGNCELLKKEEYQNYLFLSSNCYNYLYYEHCALMAYYSNDKINFKRLISVCLTLEMSDSEKARISGHLKFV